MQYMCIRSLPLGVKTNACLLDYFTGFNGKISAAVLLGFIVKNRINLTNCVER